VVRVVGSHVMRMTLGFYDYGLSLCVVARVGKLFHSCKCITSFVLFSCTYLDKLSLQEFGCMHVFM